MVRRRIIIGTVAALATIAVLLAVGGAVLHGWSRSEAGRAWIAARLASLASTPGREVTIGRLDGDPFRAFRLADVALRDSEGVWLSIASVEIVWRPASLLHGGATFDRFQANDVRLARLPAASGEPTGLPDLPRLARQLADYRVDGIVVDNLVLEPAVAGAKATLRLRGSAGIADDELVRTALTLERVDGIAGRAALSVAYPASGREFDVDLRVDEPSDGLMARLLGVPDLPALHGRVAGKGPLTEWAGEAQITFETFAALTAKLAIRHGRTTVFDVSGDAAWDSHGAADARRGSRWADVRAVIGDRVSWQAAGEVDFRRALLSLRRVAAASAFGAVSGSGRYGFDEGAGAAELAVTGHELARQSPLLGVRLGGQADLKAEARIEGRGAALKGHVHGTVRGLVTGQRIVDRLLTQTPQVDAGFILASGKLTVSDMHVTSAAATLRVDGAIGLGDASLAASYRLAVPDGVTVPVADSVDVVCRCHADGKLSGSLNDPHTDGAVSGAGMRVSGAPLVSPRLAYRLPRLASGPDGDLEGSADIRTGKLSARTDLRFVGRQWRLAGLHAESAGATLDGDLVVPEGGGAVDGTLRAKIPALEPWLAIAGLSGVGTGDLRVDLRAAGARQAASLKAEVRDGRIDGAQGRPSVRFQRLDLKADSRDLDAWKGISASAELRDAAVGDVRVDRISASANGSSSRVSVRARMEGDWHGPLSLRTEFAFTDDARGTRLDVARLEGKALDEALRMDKPLRLRWRRDELTADAFALSLGKAWFNGRLAARRDILDVNLSVADLPLRLTDRLWDTGLAGTASGTVALRGARSAPDGRVSATVAGLRLSGQSEKLGLSFSLAGDLRKGRLALNGRTSDASGQPARFSGDFPIRFEEGGWAPSIPPQAPLSAVLVWQGNAGSLWQFVPLQEHQVAGEGALDVRLKGSLSRPALQGWLTVRNGRYESLELGTVLKRLDFRVDLDGSRAAITRFAADDGNGGRVALSGGMTFDAAAGHLFDLRATFKRFAVLRRDQFEATASGALRFKGSLRSASIDGALETDRAEIRVLERLPPDVVDLDVVELGGDVATAAERREAEAPRFDPTLAINLDMPRRVFVRGRGLDSEWKGAIILRGTVHKPLFNGKLETVRGQVSVVGKSFRLQEGTVRFPDRPDAPPVLDVTTVHEGRRLTAQAHVQGPIKNPTVTLTSTPPLPPDEIVSQILFDKGASKLTRVEAAQLAITLAQLSGKGSGVGNAMEFARKTLGVDVLRLESTRTVNGDEAATVRAGKYLTDEIYIGVKQGATSESGSVGVEVEVTPNIVVESEVRRSGESDTSVKFKLDY